MLDVAIDMHLIPCHSKKLGSDLRGGERKSGTNRFEAYITAQCVNSKSRLILAALYMDKSSSVHESLREILNSCLYRRIKMRDHHSEKQGIGHLT